MHEYFVSTPDLTLEKKKKKHTCVCVYIKDIDVENVRTNRR